MSAFIVSTAHIDYLVQAALTYGAHFCRDGDDYVTGLTADRVGADLLAENITSVMVRYPDGTADTLPGPIPIPKAGEYRFDWFRHLGAVEPVAVLKAIDCYESQSCEHPAWETSNAARFCRRLRLQTISRLPGYDDAPWEID